MGNHGSRKDQRKWGKQGGKAANALSRVEELRGPSVDSYDKLIAWLAEMAENDNVELDTSVFVSQLNRVCGGRAQNNDLGAFDNASGGTSGLQPGGGVLSGNAGKRAPSSRQNSTSCDSHVSHTSSDLTPRQRSSTRSDDFLDPSSAWRSGVSTRQNTFSDDLEEVEDGDMKNASVESLYSSTDRDSELGSVSPYDSSSRRSGRSSNFPSCSPLIRPTLANKLGGEERSLVHSSSTGNLNLNDPMDDPGIRRLPRPFTKRKSVSLLNLSHPEPMIPHRTIPKLILTRETDEGCHVGSPQVCTNVRRKLGSGTKSLSLNSWKKKPAKFERQFSMYSDPHPLVSMSATEALQAIFTAPPPDPELPGAASGETAAAVFLNDALLDGNLADILFSVEALWPKK